MSSSSSSDPKTHQESDLPYTDPTSKEAIDALVHTKTLEEADQESARPDGEYGDKQDQDEEEEGEPGECGFCVFMKGGGCKDAFVSWEDCVREVESKGENIVEKCFEVTSALKLCMEAHPKYYAPILGAEKAAEKEALEELEREKAAEAEKEKEKESAGGK
ncbi:hypothetical protein Tsubulata_011436 [Turnera subulata]|uniref:GCK domain-containing protein n=1 Tax=Turnera subulata TaxID=218843 RepID=A0A9Q0FWN6_9ROSI|nr:hypothetical protein Tsubulata_011436 [Turnera subulata]